MKKTMLAAAFGALVAGAAPALAEYPERAIQLIIPYGAGGATGSVMAANAEGDGYTMLAARVGSHTVSPAMKATLPYALEDFRFVGVYEINLSDEAAEA